MVKWILLVAGLFLFVNGMFTRTYSFTDPENHCFQMDLIKFVGCSGNAALPQIAMWSAILVGAALIAGCTIWAWRQKNQRLRG